MRTVLLQLAAENFATSVRTIREWVETNQCDPLAYRYDQNEDTVRVSVDFTDPRQAEAFASRFGK